MALEIDSGAQWFVIHRLLSFSGVGLFDEIVICTRAPASLISLSWEGDVNLSRTQSLSNGDFVEGQLPGAFFQISKKAGILSMHLNHATELIGWISTDGKAWIARRTKGSTVNSQSSSPISNNWINLYSGKQSTSI